MDDALFDLPEGARTARTDTPVEELTEGQRRNRLHLMRISDGVHPLGPPLRLHPDADRSGARDGPGPRCGTCQYRVLTGGHARSFPKCVWPELEFRGQKSCPRVTFSIASDVRTWWPACTDYQPRQATSEATGDG